MQERRLQQLKFMKQLYDTGEQGRRDPRFSFAPVEYMQGKKYYLYTMNVATGKVYKTNFSTENNVTKEQKEEVLKTKNKSSYLLIPDKSIGATYKRKVSFYELWATFVCPEVLDYMIENKKDGSIEFSDLLIADTCYRLREKHDRPSEKFRLYGTPDYDVYFVEKYIRVWQLTALWKAKKESGENVPERIEDAILWAALNKYRVTLPVWVSSDWKELSGLNSDFADSEWDVRINQLLMIESYKCLFGNNAKRRSPVIELSDTKNRHGIEEWLRYGHGEDSVEAKNRKKYGFSEQERRYIENGGEKRKTGGFQFHYFGE